MAGRISDSEPDSKTPALDKPWREQLRLTRRQRQIISLLARGQSNKEIASELGISVDAVKHHLTRLYRKLGVSSRVQALLYGLRQDELSTRKPLTKLRMGTSVPFTRKGSVG